LWGPAVIEDESLRHQNAVTSAPVTKQHALRLLGTYMKSVIGSQLN
jgi:hypothetical protein